MMKALKFTKMVASGNDFVVIEKGPSFLRVGLRELARRICDRKFGIGADGMLVLEKSKTADITMRILNADGTEAEMCGNGARCVALFYCRMHGTKEARLQTKAGIIEAKLKDRLVRIRLTDPAEVLPDYPLRLNLKTVRVSCVNTGVPHAVIFVQGLENIDVSSIGRSIRFHKQFFPAGTNVNFVEVLRAGVISVRTYERGVEDETLACGTGSSASALIYALKAGIDDTVSVKTRGGETLKVYFERTGDSFHNVWLEGKAGIVAEGRYLL